MVHDQNYDGHEYAVEIQPGDAAGSERGEQPSSNDGPHDSQNNIEDNPLLEAVQTHDVGRTRHACDAAITAISRLP